MFIWWTKLRIETVSRNNQKYNRRRNWCLKKSEIFTAFEKRNFFKVVSNIIRFNSKLCKNWKRVKKSITNRELYFRWHNINEKAVTEWWRKSRLCFKKWFVSEVKTIRFRQHIYVQSRHRISFEEQTQQRRENGWQTRPTCTWCRLRTYSI